MLQKNRNGIPVLKSRGRKVKRRLNKKTQQVICRVTGKLFHKTSEEAQKQANEVDVKMHTYFCTDCQGWHVGHFK